MTQRCFGAIVKIGLKFIVGLIKLILENEINKPLNATTIDIVVKYCWIK